jgi:hypothetical protein
MAKVMRLVLMICALMLTAPAFAQDQVGPQDLTRTTADPVEKLVGLWMVDKLEGAAPAGLAGRVLRIDRQSVASLTLGTCTNPSFDEKLGSITVNCVGQKLASATWDPQEPGTMRWSEGGFQAMLHRLSGTEAADSPPPAAEAAPADADEGAQDSE